MSGMVFVTFGVGVLWICSAMYQLQAVNMCYQFVLFSLIMPVVYLLFSDSSNTRCNADAEFYFNFCNHINGISLLLFWAFGNFKM